MLIFRLFVQAQNSSVIGRFEVDFSVGCAPLKVVINETDTFPPETVRQYDFEGDGIFVGFEPTEEVTFTYTQPGSYEIVQVINVDIVPKTDTLFIEVFQIVTPDFSIFTCENNGAKIEISPDLYEQHRIFFTLSDSVTVYQGENIPSYTYPAGSHSISVKGLFINGKDNCGVSTKNFTTIQNLISADLHEVYLNKKDPDLGQVRINYSLTSDIIYLLEKADDVPAGFNVVDLLPSNSSTYILNSIDTENKLPVFRISAFDACQDKSIYSDTISVIRVSGIAENNQNRIFWDIAPIQFDNYEIFKNGQSINIFNSQNLKEFIDNQVTCFEEYCYRVEFNNKSGGKSYSDTVCLEAFKIYFPPPVKNTTVSVDDMEVDLTWTPVENITANSFFIQRRIEDDVYATLDTVITDQYSDLDADVNSQSICYRISYLDECMNRSNLGDLSCTVFLNIEDNRVLRWNDYIGWQNGVKEYFLEVYDEEGTLEEEIDLGTGNIYEITDYIKQQIKKYRIRVESNDDPSLIAYSNFVIKQIESVFWLPNAFTPNGDGLNDAFKPEGTLMVEFNMKIYSRYGNLLFETEDQELGWDGTSNGTEMPFNTYIYRIETVDNIGKSYNQTGKVLLIRE